MMKTNRLPQHLAIVMDGNGRWAQQRSLPRIAGHEAGAESVKQIVRLCGEKGISVLTLFAFSCENWRRPEAEVEHLMSLFLQTLRQETPQLNQNNIQLRVIGDRTRFSNELREQITYSEQLTQKNTGLVLVIAANYSGRWDITTAVRNIAELVKEDNLSLDDIDSDLVNHYLCLHTLPPPDLFIRTSGEQRISNFMLWQFAYTELYFTKVLWPDFTAEEFEAALLFYASRERRYGGVSELNEKKTC